MTNLKLLRDLERYPVFTVKQIASIANKDMNYTYLMVYRLKRAGLVQEIEKGKYTMEKNPFIIASWIVWPSYISSWAALNFYKLTEQLPFVIHVVTTVKRKSKTISFENGRIEFLTFKRERLLGFEKRVYQNREIFIAEKEKAIVDAVAARKMSINEAVEIIKNNRRKLNMRKLFYYGKAVKGLNKKLEVLLYDKKG